MEQVLYEQDARPLSYTPTWSIASILVIFISISFFLERSIHNLTNRLRKSKRKPLLEALEKMKEELMLIGFMSFILISTPDIISRICIPSKLFDSAFSPCSRSEIADESHGNASEEKNKTSHILSVGRTLIELNQNKCMNGFEPMVSTQGLEQLHRFIFLMAFSHITYSCLTMLLAIMKIRDWKSWEDEAHRERIGPEITRKLTQRQSAIITLNESNPLLKNVCVAWVTCFFRQFGNSVDRVDYLTLRKAFIMNHNLPSKYDFHSYMIRSMEDEFHRIVGVSGRLWGFVVTFMLFNVDGSNLYFWTALIAFGIILVVGAKLQHIIATLAMESSAVTELFTGTKFRPRDELFWFKKPKLLLSLLHFCIFQNSFDLASFFWTWWQFGENSCFLKDHVSVALRLLMGLSGEFICSYITLPLYALGTQMGTLYKAALIPEAVRESIHGWVRDTRRRRRRRKYGFGDGSTTTHSTNRSSTTDGSVYSQLTTPRSVEGSTGIELQNIRVLRTNSTRIPSTSSRPNAPFLRPSSSASSLIFPSNRKD